jgi:hypothetical protein
MRSCWTKLQVPVGVTAICSVTLAMRYVRRSSACNEFPWDIFLAVVGGGLAMLWMLKVMIDEFPGLDE